jgi:NDP-sugar pyrophosphorylase family protein
MNDTGRFEPGMFFSLPESALVKKLFPEHRPVWTGLDNILSACTAFFEKPGVLQPLPENFQVQTWVNREKQTETIVYLQKGFLAEQDWVFPEYHIALGKGSSIEPGVVIKPPLIVGRQTEVRQSAYLRGGVIVGDHCTIGHATEVKTAVFLNHSEAGHFAYVGDSIIGNYVNLGAGSRLANLPFRSLELKQKQAFDELVIKYKNEKLPISRTKLGAILGDGVETGCNTVIAPGSFIGRDTWIYPGLFVKSGYYSGHSIIKSDSRLLIVKKK